MEISIFPNPGSDLIAIQVGQLVKNDLNLELIDMSGRIVKTSKINTGSTIAFFDIQTLYEGAYFIKLSNSKDMIIKKVT
ncbi:MAG TPA: T9SS type A sorting domain-containing protein, partial [Bacteroidetes bacterium]|nr:T9SS type A sorting domain-containing protein [Bacteroidota bacterium]